MMAQGWLIAGAVLAFGSVAVAQERAVDRTHLYASSPEGCASMEADGVGAFDAMDFVTLSFTDGIQTLERHCAFFGVQDAPNSSALFVSSVCETPVGVYPDTLSIMPTDEGVLSVTSSADLAQGLADPDPQAAEAPGVSTFHRCNLTELPR